MVEYWKTDYTTTPIPHENPGRKSLAIFAASAPGQDHLSVRNPGFVKDCTDAAKALGFVECDHRDLSVKIYSSRAEPLCHNDGAPQQLFSHTFSSILFQNRHAPDLRAATAQNDSRRSHRFA